MKYSYKAPTRIDLAGGTLDLWPIYLMVEKAVTVNAAIDLTADAVLTEREDPKIVIRSIDRDITLEYRSIDDIPGESPLELVTGVIRFYRPEKGFDLTVDCSAPEGSGLGGSSSLNIALNKVLSSFASRPMSGEETINTARDIETIILGKPAGVQDYYPPSTGGVLEIEYGVGFNRALYIDVPGTFLEDRVVLCYTGESRSSADNNWEVYRAFLEGAPDVVNAMQGVASAAGRAADALKSGSFRQLTDAVEDEWERRKGLFSGIETPRMKDIAGGAYEAGAIASKACGAGGGGCMIFLCERERRTAVSSNIEQRGGTILDFRIAPFPRLIVKE